MWDGQVLKLTFRRCVDASFLEKWKDLLYIINRCIPNEEADKPIWTLNVFGSYSTKSFYKQINRGGVSTPGWDKFWKITVPHRYVVHNKKKSRDNLSHVFSVMNLKLLIIFYVVVLLQIYFQRY